MGRDRDWSAALKRAARPAGPTGVGAGTGVARVRAVHTLYAALEHGDVATVVEAVTPDTHWFFAAGDVVQRPWHREVRGVAQLAALLYALQHAIVLERFEPGEFIHCGPHVLVEVRVAYTVVATGRRVDMDQLQWWTLDARDRVQRLKCYEDSAQLRDAVARSARA